MTRGKASWDADDCALILLDYQPEMFKAIGSSDPEMVEKNICALWTEICLAFPVVEALRDGYEVSFVADAVAEQSKEEHEIAVQRLIQAGAIPNTSVAMLAEWFRDWKSPRATRGREILVSLMREHRHALHGGNRGETYESPEDSYASQSEMM